RYGSMMLDPDKLKFIDRMVADSRNVALNHTAGLSLPQQAQMALFSLFALLDPKDGYKRRCRDTVQRRYRKLFEGMGIPMNEDPLRTSYYAQLDIEAWATHAVGADFVTYVKTHRDPL